MKITHNNFLHNLHKMLCVFSFFIFSFSSAEITITGDATFYVSENTTVVGLELSKETTATKTQEIQSVTISEEAIIVGLENIHSVVAKSKTVVLNQTVKSPETKATKTVKESLKLQKSIWCSKYHSHPVRFTTGIFSANQAVLSFYITKITTVNFNYFIVQQPQLSKEIVSDYTNPLVSPNSFGGQCFTRPPTFL